MGCSLLVDYEKKAGFVMMQRGLVRVHNTLSLFRSYIPTILRQLKCPVQGDECIMCQKDDETIADSGACPKKCARWKLVGMPEQRFDLNHHTCYNPIACNSLLNRNIEVDLAGDDLAFEAVKGSSWIFFALIGVLASSYEIYRRVVCKKDYTEVSERL